MRVLIVDDEPSILLFINTVLREAGYDTVLAQDGDDALNKRGTFDLVVTDVMMPRMRGEALAAKMRKRDPHVPVLYLTAYSDRLFERKRVLDEGEGFLEKPVTGNALLEGVERLVYGPMGPDRESQIRRFEQDAENLVVYQLDLLAQLERQLRAVHHTMRHIEKLRNAKHRVGRELSNGQRGEELVSLSDEIAQLEVHFKSEHECCTDMQITIAHMQNLLADLRQRVASARPSHVSASESSPDAES